MRFSRLRCFVQRINHHFNLSNDFFPAGYPLAFNRVESSPDQVSTTIVEEQMATRTALVLIIIAMVSIIVLPLDSGFAQDTKGRWVLGFHGGANLWSNDYNQRLVGEGGEIMVRYGITRLR